MLNLEKIQFGEKQHLAITLQDVTQKKKTEREARIHARDLIHISRISTMGELMSSLVHEFNQPLMAILSNAQAALRFLRKKIALQSRPQRLFPEAVKFL